MAGSAARRRRQFRKYRSLLRRWVWFVLVCAVIAAGSAYVVTKRQAPTYRASTLLIVDQRTPGGDAYSNLLASDQLVQTYLSLIATPSVLEEAARQIGGVSAADLAARVRVSNPGISTQILQVQVDDRDPRRAARLANAIATSFITLQQQTAAHEFHNASQQLHQQFAGVSERLSALTNRINAIQAANPNDPRLATLRAQLAAMSGDRDSWLTADSQLMLQTLVETNNIRVFQAALPPTSPASPNVRLTVAAAGLAGFVLAASLVLLLELLDDRVRTVADVEEVTGLMTVGTVASQRKGQDLLTAHNNSRLAESFRNASRNLSFASLDRPLSTIVVTSALPNEGKTTVAINLAMSLALAGWRVLLIDADLRRPTVHKRLHLPAANGLTLHLLKGDQGLGEALPVLTLPTVPHLLVLPAGPIPPNPTELLGSARMQHFLESVLPREGQSGLADIVVLDTPAAAGVADAAVLAAHASCTLLVVDAKRSREGQLMRVLDALSRVNARVAGVVLNHAEQQGEEVSYYAYDRPVAGENRPAVRHS